MAKRSMVKVTTRKRGTSVEKKPRSLKQSRMISREYRRLIASGLKRNDAKKKATASVKDDV